MNPFWGTQGRMKILRCFVEQAFSPVCGGRAAGAFSEDAFGLRLNFFTSHQKTNFIASCMILGSVDPVRLLLVMIPKDVAVFNVTPGLLNRVAFRTLKASARNSSLSLSRTRNS